MCFCFDGENAVAAYRPDDCRERLPAAGAPTLRPIASRREPSRLAAALEPIDARQVHHLAAALVPMY
ncbi:hypothetical protein D3227_03885 [Mesorhizobium waimense]|uniref:Uncharacterized protein n=1 Tax=Mesorhizobium waimense TaxID=1300307 RepID=A0A3A5L2P4_9HYPH|nr:hypothetical protein [Mesorhizobium waimense]RJT41847.1 hypothetical protein D3227_03885 [Mesorhizobium waimense]